MSRLNFIVGDTVIFREQTDTPFQVMRVEPALEHPYFLSNNQWAGEHEVQVFVKPEAAWEEVETSIKGIVKTLRDTFDKADKNYMRFRFEASGRTHGEIKIEYAIGTETYNTSNDVAGYSLRPVLHEFFRRKSWEGRNAPIALTFSGKEKSE